jgi:hypothetical protein
MTEHLLEELRARFRETMAIRLREMEALLETLAREPANGDAVARIGRHFHAMVGLGATYGFPLISQLGDEGEASSLILGRTGSPVTPHLHARWCELVAAALHDLEAGGVSR